MSRKIHHIVQNDVRFSSLPEHLSPPDEALGRERTTRKHQPRAGSRPGGSPAAALPPAALAVGLYRTRGEADCPSDVRILSNGCSFFVTEAEYRRRECQPFFEDLPWYGVSDGKPAQGKC